MFPTIFSLGVLYLLGLGVGRLSAKLRIPRVTGYLVVGLLAGPSLADLTGFPAIITINQLDNLQPLHEFILGLIVLTIGGAFQPSLVRKFGARLFRISSIEIGLTALCTIGLTFIVGATPLAAGFLALMAITTAPAATQMVMREYESEGPLSDTIIPLIAMNNFVAIVAFILLKNSTLTDTISVSDTALQIFGPIGLGMLFGTLLAIMDQRMTRTVERQILVLASVAAIVGLCSWLSISSMLATLIAGLVLVTASPNEKRLLSDLASIDYPLYVVFFIMAGARLHLEHLPHMGTIGVAYIAARIMGKYFGCWFGARSARTSQTIRTWLGPAMLAQAGLAIGLANSLHREWMGEGHHIQTVILAAVVVFEVIGPLLTRFSLKTAGEITVLNLLVQRSPVGYAEGLHQVLNQFKDSLGIGVKKEMEDPSDILVAHVMRRNVESIRSNVPFDEVLKTLGHSRYDRLPVVNAEKDLVGVIQYADISEVLFDPSLRNLVVAGDIATQEHFILTPDDSLATAMQQLKTHKNHSYVLVVDAEDRKKLVGVVRHNDVLSVQRRLRQEG